MKRIEYLVYLFVVVLALAELTWSAYQISRLFETGPYAGSFHLYKGWFAGFHNDLSDIQWRMYRESLPALACCLSLYVAISRTLLAPTTNNNNTHYYRAAHHVFAVAASCVLVIVLHGAFAAHVFVSLLLHYGACSAAAGRRWAGPVAVYAVPAAIWLVARAADGLPFGALSPALAFLDGYAGVVRWQTGFNLAMLRMISWGLDLHWTRLRQRGHDIGFETNAPTHVYTKVPHRFAGLAAKQRQLVNHSAEWYQLSPFLHYVLYPPLYLTGPTITFNDFICQLRCSTYCKVSDLAKYAGRLLGSLLALEVLTHTLYVNAFTRFKVWERDGAEAAFTARAMAAAAFYKLIFLWLKFLVIWRTARLFTLADGVDPPENMLRCVCNNYDISGFWRNWHASFNRWLVRYMYIPLGGARYRLLNVWPIFTFVALWHDLEWHLLKWAWLMALFLVPEVACKALIHRPAWRRRWDRWWFDHLCAAFAAVYISIMMTVNLVGYGMGGHGVSGLLSRVLGSPQMVIGMFVSFYCASHLMFAIRRREAAAKGSLGHLA